MATPVTSDTVLAGGRANAHRCDTPLIDAARHGARGRADVVALLADGADVNEPTTDGCIGLRRLTEVVTLRRRMGR